MSTKDVAGAHSGVGWGDQKLAKCAPQVNEIMQLSRTCCCYFELKVLVSKLFSVICAKATDNGGLQKSRGDWGIENCYAIRITQGC